MEKTLEWMFGKQVVMILTESRRSNYKGQKHYSLGLGIEALSEVKLSLLTPSRRMEDWNYSSTQH
jgi:hypothetical protein